MYKPTKDEGVKLYYEVLRIPETQINGIIFVKMEGNTMSTDQNVQY